MPDVIDSLTAFVDRALTAAPDGCFHHCPAADWPSPCELPGARWRPVLQTTALDFRGLEHALDVALHPDAAQFFGHFWSGSLPAQTAEGEVHLIQLWNEADFENLVANQIGHALNKRRSKGVFNPFFATTEEDSELFLTIDNQTGAVLLERPLGPPVRQVSGDLVTFLDRLESVTPAGPSA